jgi:hypothetical protein
VNSHNLHVVVEGIGNVVQSYYAKPLKRLFESYPTRLKITFVDDSTYWRSERNSEQIGKFISSVRSWGADYIDKASRRGKSAYKRLAADVVFIATPDCTHVGLAMEWLAKPDRCSQIFIEKPIDASLSRARDLLVGIRENDPKVRALDHYRARMIPIVSSPLQYKSILRELGGQITGFTFYFLEDGSLFRDERGHSFTNDPIEALGRSKSLQSGLILDMMPHVPAVLSYFGIVDSIRVLGVRVGRYTYTDKYGNKQEASIPRETFAHIRFSFRGYDSQPIKGDVFLGKGIRGSTDLEKEGDIKLLELMGKKGKKFKFDLRGSADGGDVVLVDKKNNEHFLIKLVPDAYGTIIRLIVESKLNGTQSPLFFDMPVELAKNIRIAIEEMLHPIKNVDLNPAYHISAPNGDVSGAPYLELVRDALSPVQQFL